MEEKLIQEYVEYFRAVLKDADKKDSALRFTATHETHSYIRSSL